MSAGAHEAGSKWDHHFLRLALDHSDMSKDPRTRVGAVITTMDGTPRSDGFNGFPRGIADNAARLGDRDVKNRLMVHAEQNALMNALRNGVSTLGCRLFIACTDDTGEVWGGAPCASNCVKLVIQAGMVEVVCYPGKRDTQWQAEIDESIALMAEAGMRLRIVAKPPGLLHVRRITA